jgi:4-amino-4-deoxychorismate lyase
MLLALAVSGRGVVDPGEPAVHADDEAVLRGRAAFETMRVYRGRPFRLSHHLERLSTSASRMGLAQTDPGAFRALAEQALAQAGVHDAVLRLIWTAGREGGAPVALALVSSLPPDLEARRARGVRLVSLLGVKAEAPWLLGGVKSTSYAVNVAAEAEARRRGGDDAVFVDADGIVLEGPVTNVWWRRGTSLFTPARALGILAGVTRAALAELAPGLGYEVREGAYRLDELAAADEALTSSSVREVLPVVALDGAPVGDGTPGEAGRALQAGLRALAESPDGG